MRNHERKAWRGNNLNYKVEKVQTTKLGNDMKCGIIFHMEKRGIHSV